MFKRAQMGLAGAIISVLIAVVIGVGAVLPVVIHTVNGVANVNSTGGVNGTILASGVTVTVINLIPLMIGVVIFVAIASLVAMK